jgi:adhesin transport system membrane fusion protein
MKSAHARWDELPGEEGRARWLPHALLAAIAAFFLFALAWAAITKLDEVARGEGRVITQSQVQLVQNLEGGILAEILVREGDMVEKDQVLMRIDPTRYVAAFREGEQGALALKARIARLEAEANGTRFAMPGAVLKASPALASHERSLFDTRKRDVESKNEILRQQLAQRENELAELRVRGERLSESLELIRKEIAITAPLVKQGVMSEIELLRQEREAARIRTELEAATHAAPRLRAAIAEARKKMEDGELAFRAQSGVELSQARAELAKLSEGLPALEDRVSRATVRSPMKGIIRTIPNKTVGGVVQPGSPMAEIVPVEETLLVETRLRPADIAFVHLGQRAVVKISAYDYSIYGGLDGKIEYVSADSMQPQQGEPYYLAHVRTASNAINFQGRELRVMPGMTASVDILTGKRSVLDYLLKPVNRARERALTER